MTHVNVVEDDVNSLVKSLHGKGVNFKAQSILVMGGAGFRLKFMRQQ